MLLIMDSQPNHNYFKRIGTVHESVITITYNQEIFDHPCNTKMAHWKTRFLMNIYFSIISIKILNVNWIFS